MADPCGRSDPLCVYPDVTHQVQVEEELQPRDRAPVLGGATERGGLVPGSSPDCLLMELESFEMDIVLLFSGWCIC